MPARQALVSMTQVFIDTMIVCSITGITIVMADMYVTEKVMHSPRYPLLISLVQSAQSLWQSAYFYSPIPPLLAGPIMAKNALHIWRKIHM